MRIDRQDMLAVGIVGHKSRVRERIEFLLRRGDWCSPRAAMRSVIASSVFLIAAMAIASLAPRWIAFAQPPQHLEFEVASVKPHLSGRDSIREMNPGSLTYTNRALAEFILLAYDVQPWQVTHSPAIVLADRYDIVAKAANPAPEAQIRLMLRSLLEDRFKLKVHTETRKISAFILTVSNNGPHFKPSQTEGPIGAWISDGAFHYTRASMEYFAGRLLSNLPSLGHPVVDRTGLSGIYDFALNLGDPDGAGNTNNAKEDTIRQVDAGLSTSLKDLGLKLELQQTPLQFLIIDHIEKPDAN